MSRSALVLPLILLGGCATAPRVPEWTSAPARDVDNGYIVYTGTAIESDPNQAQLAAEGTAIQDLANECSFVPKGARVENQFRLKTKDGYEAYAQVAVDFPTCVSAQQAVQPDDIKKLASAPFMDELKRYQDFVGSPTEIASAGDSPENPAAPPAVTDDADYFLARQYVAYQKQVVILAPPGAYAAGSWQTRVYVNNVTQVIRPLQVYYAKNPRLRSAPTTWSTIEARVRERHPRAFKTTYLAARGRRKPQRRAWPKKKGGRRRRRDD